MNSTWTPDSIIFSPERNYIDQIHHYFLNLQIIIIIFYGIRKCEYPYWGRVHFTFTWLDALNSSTEGLSDGGRVKGLVFCGAHVLRHVFRTSLLSLSVHPHHHQQQQQHMQGSPTSSFLKIIFRKTRPKANVLPLTPTIHALRPHQRHHPSE